MKLTEVHWHPSRRQLRQFAVVCVVALPMIGWMWGASGSTVGLLAIIAAALAMTSVFMPQAVKPVYLCLMLIAAPIGMLLGEIALLMIYFGLFLPIGIVFKVLRRDALGISFDRRSTTYWQAKKQARNAASYYHQS